MLLYLFRYSNTALLVGVHSQMHTYGDRHMNAHQLCGDSSEYGVCVCVCVFVHQVGGTFGGRGVVVSIHLLAQICIYIYIFL